MKIGIVTINSAHNYGCMLQAWALQTYLEKQGAKVEIINYRISAIDDGYQLPKAKLRFTSPLLQSAYKKYFSVKYRMKNKSAVDKYNKFEDFIKNKLHTTKAYSTLTEIQQELSGAYDFLITGSDQVWNGEITRGLRPVYFLGFDTKNTKKISYASSIGKSELLSYEKEFFEKYLTGYQCISVREESARQMLQPLVKQPITVVIDPALLLLREDYEPIKRKTSRKQPYILVHVVNSDKEVKPIAEKLSEMTGLPIVHNRPVSKYKNELENFHGTGPGEFLSLIENADYVVTNSFHATVFALQYERPFLTIPHKKYPERMKHLLDLTGLSGHLIEKKDDLVTEEQCFVEYTIVNAKLAAERKKSEEYLLHAIEITAK